MITDTIAVRTSDPAGDPGKEGVRSLCEEMIKRTAEDLSKGPYRIKRNGTVVERTEYGTPLNWLLNCERGASRLSFQDACEMLNVNPDIIRKGILNEGSVMENLPSAVCDKYCVF